MGVLENWYINQTNCLHGATRFFPALLCSCAAWAFSKTLFLSECLPLNAHSAPPSRLSANHFLMICTALVRRLVSLFSQRLTRLLSYYFAFFDFRPEMVPPLDFLFILPVPSLSRRRPLKRKYQILSLDISQLRLILNILTIEIFWWDICIRIAL